MEVNAQCRNDLKRSEKIIKTARDKSDLTVEELTARVGISERYLYRIENEGKVPTFEVLKKIVRGISH